MLNIFDLLKNKKSLYQNFKPVVLVVLDGFGVAPNSYGNAIARATKPNLDYFWKNYPSSSLIASGESVGLPANQVGNSEVGHLTIGAGRVVVQELERINEAIKDGSFFENKALLQLTSHLSTYNSRLHLMGLVSSGNVHSSVDHLYAVLEFAKRQKIKNISLHVFLDGRDAQPMDGINVVDKLNKFLIENDLGRIASISGRFYAMDRDRRWERTELAYKAIVEGLGPTASDPLVCIKSYYDNGITDEFIPPTVITQNLNGQISPVGTVNDNDGVFFFNFRADRAIQLSLAFTYPDFENLKSFKFGHQPGAAKQIGEATFTKTFNRGKFPKNMFFVSMAEYHKDIAVSSIAFKPNTVNKSLPEILSANSIKQAHLAESEKEKMVTYYFDGLREDPYFGEDTYIVASPRVPTYDKKPEMSLGKLVSEFKHELYKGIYGFFVMNFANPDMVAHSGNIDATIKGIDAVDKALGELYKEVLGFDGTLIITADHGHAESMQNFSGGGKFFYTSETGEINTEHSANPVPFIIINRSLAGRKLMNGSLEDVAPTILNIMKFVKPVEMTGKNLLV